jgi:hypothetical protein
MTRQIESGRDPCNRVRPGHESGSVGKREPEQFADDGERQPSRIPLDEIGRASLGEQFAGKPIGDGKDARLHVEDRPAAEGFVHDPPQSRVVGLVHSEHVVREHANDARHPPAKPGNAAVLAQCERTAVFQHAAGQLMRRRDPDLADDRKPDLDDRPARP